MNNSIHARIHYQTIDVDDDGIDFAMLALFAIRVGVGIHCTKIVRILFDFAVGCMTMHDRKNAFK